MKEHMDYVIKILPLLISIISLVISLKTHFAKIREGRPSFSIVQNLWTNSPYYELINDADSKLDFIPSPSYFMFIPSKVYFQLDGENCVSTFTLSPVSYDVVIEQIVSGSTKKGIVKSILPANFSAKKGERDVIYDSVKLEKDFPIGVETYPFLVIISEVEYTYKSKRCKDILMSTPFETIKIDEKTLIHIREYLHDNYHHEVRVPDDSSSIYIKTNKQVISACKNLKENVTFLGGKEGGYGYVLKKLNRLITPMDPMQKYYEKEIKNGWMNRIKGYFSSRKEGM